jgi:hypothetical protein
MLFYATGMSGKLLLHFNVQIIIVDGAQYDCAVEDVAL